MTDTELQTATPAEEAQTQKIPVANRKPIKAEAPADKKKKKEKKTWKQELLEWVVTLAVALVIAFVVRSFLFEPVYVDGNSMFPTLRHGEIMYVSKTSYGSGFFGIPFTDIGFYFNVGGNPERFDVVVCHYEDKGYNVVKRVVGLPGDTVQVIEGYLYVTDRNGVNVGGYDRAGKPLPVDEDFIYHRGHFNYGPYTVPCAGDVIDRFGVVVPGGAYDENGNALTEEQLAARGLTICEEDQFFLMGDNRTNSLDSREKGPVSRSEIVGKVESVLWHVIPNRLDDQYGLNTH